jgi:murein DD-endopeptidase MepM/ murein hydrolase activator NlpD
MSPDRFLSVIIVPEDGRESHTFRISHKKLKLAVFGALLATLALTAMAGSWWHLAARAARVSALEAQVALQARDRARVEAFATQIAELERRYEQIRRLFGPDADQLASDLWLPPPAPRGPGGRATADPDGSLPTSWPLSQRGFVTQGLLRGEAGEHPGLDVAVPTDSYIRAAGAAVVVDVGEDPVYGRFVTLDHGAGYRSLYAHASQTLVELGQHVRRNEVIALTGSTGRSTAPHLHFEILLNGERVDPLTMVQQP